jgi:hypothetical protein
LRKGANEASLTGAVSLRRGRNATDTVKDHSMSLYPAAIEAAYNAALAQSAVRRRP